VCLPKHDKPHGITIVLANTSLMKFIILFMPYQDSMGHFSLVQVIYDDRKKSVHLNPVGPYCATLTIRSLLLHTEEAAHFVFISHSFHFTSRFLSSLHNIINQYYFSTPKMAAKYDSKYVLVTGGAGYIGKNLTELNGFHT
jgi:hypothetical protein